MYQEKSGNPDVPTINVRTYANCVKNIFLFTSKIQSHSRTKTDVVNGAIACNTI
jgi:hypothetical protein